VSNKLNVKHAAELAGVPEKTFRMHILRGKIVTVKDEGRIAIEEDDLRAYMVTEGLLEVAASAQGKPAPQVYKSLSTVLSELPQDIKDAILQSEAAR
jgi:hypothetical protein